MVEISAEEKQFFRSFNIIKSKKSLLKANMYTNIKTIFFS